MNIDSDIILKSGKIRNVTNPDNPLDTDIVNKGWILDAIDDKIAGSSGLSDTNVNSPVDGQVLVYDNSEWTNKALQITNVSGLQAQLSGKANINHTHTIANIDNLQTTLNNKANSSHTHGIADVDNLQSALDSKSNTNHTHTIDNVNNLQQTLDGKANNVHTHGISDIVNLTSELSSKASSVHTHSIVDINNLQNELDGKANTSHTHTIANITNLQDTLNSKANSSSLGTAATKNVGTSEGNVPILNADGKLPDSVIPHVAITDVFVVSSESEMLGLSTANSGDMAIRTDIGKNFILLQSPSSTLSNWKDLLNPTGGVESVNGKVGNVMLSASDVGAASSTHTHSIADINNLQQALDGKANLSHTHTIANVINLQSTLDGKANSVHSHNIADINNLQSELNNKVNQSLLGDAATKNTGTSAGNVPIINQNGKLESSILPVNSIDDLSDVNVSGVSDGQVLTYDSNSQVWSASTISVSGVIGLNGLTDVAVTSPSLGQVMRYNGTLWVNSGLSIGDISSLQSALDQKANLSSPSFSGNPTATTQNINNSGTRLATTEFVHKMLEEYDVSESVQYDSFKNITKQTVTGDFSYTIDYVYANASQGRLNYSEKTYVDGGNTIKIRKTYTYDTDGYITNVSSQRTVTPN